MKALAATEAGSSEKLSAVASHKARLPLHKEGKPGTLGVLSRFTMRRPR